LQSLTNGYFQLHKHKTFKPHPYIIYTKHIKMENTVDITKLKGFNINILNHSKIQFIPNTNVQPLKGAMTRFSAVQLMRTSTTIHEWNTNRETIKNNVGVEAFLNCGYTQDIDGSGLINKIGLIRNTQTPGVKIYKPFQKPTA
jgi:hypothetical protein